MPLWPPLLVLLIVLALSLGKPAVKMEEICKEGECTQYITPSEEDSTGQHVFRNVWIGSVFAATNHAWLKHKGITDVISLIGAPANEDKANGVTYHIVNIADSYDQEIVPTVLEVYKLFKGIPEHNRNILVHCAAGVSRSATVVLGLMLLTRDYDTLDSALEDLREAREVVNPNQRFMRDLRDIETQRTMLLERLSSAK